jgi:hypothetical protein
MINNENEVELDNCVEIFKDCQPFIDKINFIENFYNALVIEQNKNKDIDGVYMRYSRSFYIPNYKISPNKVRINLRDLYSYNRKNYSDLIDFIKDIKIKTLDNATDIPFSLCFYTENFKYLDSINSDYISLLKFKNNLVIKIEFELPYEMIKNIKIYYTLYTFSILKVTKILELNKDNDENIYHYFSNSKTIC